MKGSIAAFAACLLLIGAALAGCGDDSTDNGGDVASSAGAEAGDGEAPPGANGPTGSDEGGGDGEASRGGGSTDGSESSGGGGEPPSGSGSPGGGKASSGAGGGGPPASGPKADFVAEANALCSKQRRQIKAEVNDIFQRAKGTGTQSQQTALRNLVTSAIVPGLEAEANGLRELDPPPGDEADIEALAAAIDAVVAEAQADPTAFLANSTAFNETRKLAREYGIGPCGTLS